MIRSLKDILIVSDMDGTLLTAREGIPACNLATINLFCAMGGHFTVATGRTIQSAGRYLGEQPFINEPAILYGGCVIYDVAQKERLQSVLLPKAEARHVIWDALTEFPSIGVEIMAENGRIYMVQNNEYAHNHVAHEKLEFIMGKPEDVLIGWHKVFFACDNLTRVKMQNYFEKRKYPGVYLVSTSENYIEVMPRGVNKGTALKALCKKIGIPIENTIAIGDYYNDLDLFKVAGHTVAMCNAPDEVKQIADEITEDCPHGGVGQFIYRLIQKYS